MSGDFDKSKPKRIPEQTQISPELDAQIEKQALAKEQFYRRWFFIRNLLIALLVVGLPLVIFFFFKAADRNERESDSNLTDLVQPLNDFELLLKNGSTFKLEEHSRQLEGEIASGIVPRQLAAYKVRLRIADELIRRNSDDNSFRFGVVTKIKTLSALASFDRATGQPANPFGSDLLVFCEQYTNDEDPRIRNAARLGEFNADVNEYLLNPTDPQFAELEKKLDKFISALSADVGMAGEIPTFIGYMSNSANEKHLQQFQLRLAEGLQNSNEFVLRSVGDTIRDRLVVGTVNFHDMRRLIKIRDQPTFLKLEELISSIVDNPNVSVSTYFYFLTLAESLHQINQNEMEDRLVEKLRSSAGKLSDDDKRKSVIKFFDDHDVRNGLVGKHFELGSYVTENPAVPTKVPAVILFVSATRHNASEWIDFLKSLDELRPSASRYIMVCTDAELSEEFRRQTKAVFSKGILVGPENKGLFLQQCPIAQVPYVVLLDKNDRVAAVNVDIDQVRNQLTDLIDQ